MSDQTDQSPGQPSMEQVVQLVIDRFEQRVDAQEQLVSNLVMGFVELSVAVEGLTKQVLDPLTEDQRKDFAKEVLSMRSEMMKFLNTATEKLAHDDFSFAEPVATSFTESMEDMAQGN